MSTHEHQARSDKNIHESGSALQKQTGSGSVFQYANNKPEAIAQRKMQDMAHNSQQAKQLMAFQEMANLSSQTRQTAQLQTLARTGVIQRYPYMDDSGRLDAVIYVIYVNNGKNDGSNVLYVGQTTSDREFKRFQEHVGNDAWAPWYIHATAKGIDYDNIPRKNWPYDYAVVENLKNVTKFETTVAEQWWMEHYMKQGRKLLNDSTPCTIENFNKRSGDSSLYDPKNIGVPSSYKPSLKAK